MHLAGAKGHISWTAALRSISRNRTEEDVMRKRKFAVCRCANGQDTRAGDSGRSTISASVQYQSITPAALSLWSPYLPQAYTAVAELGTSI